MTCTLYCITNKTTQKLYVGLTERGVAKRWQQHCQDAKRLGSKFHAAIDQYGPDDFVVDTLHECATRAEAEIAEIALINQLNLMELGYNGTLGGDGFRPGRAVDAATCQKISDAKKGKQFSEKHKIALRKPKSAKGRAARSALRREEWASGRRKGHPISQEMRSRIGSLTRARGPEYKAAARASCKLRWAEGGAAAFGR